MTEQSETQLRIIVERAVRLVLGSAARKNRMREELLAHLTAIAEDELASHGDELRAVQRASERLGSPALLTRDLQNSLPLGEKWTALVENTLGRRPSEPALRYTLRLSALLLFLDAILLLGTFGAVILLRGYEQNDFWYRLRIAVAFMLINSADTVLVGLIYSQLRGALCRGLGFERSPWRAVVWTLTVGLIGALSLPAFFLLGVGSLNDGLVHCYRFVPPAIAFALFLAVHARLRGPLEIRHAEWERLDIAS
jgi:hypothetical protein